MRSLRPFILVGSLFVAAQSAWAAEEAAAEGPKFEDKLAACTACHGPNGAKPIMPEYPVLAGQHPDYIAHALRDYATGRRNNPIMAAQVQALKLSEEDMKRLGEYFAAQTSPLATLRH
jgi:cytochrome c553